MAWCSARAQGGQVRLRLDNLDTQRCRPHFEDAALVDLEWLGLDWDGPALRQAERKGELRALALSLLERGLAYCCTCTRAEIKRATSAPHAGEEGARYPGTCRGRYADRRQALGETGREPALRLIAPTRLVRFDDALLGSFSERVDREVGDFVIGTRDGSVAYQLAVVADDAAQGVTEVVRGDDLLSSTARQRVLQDLLGLPAPRYAHVPLVVDASGRRLAKRSHALSLRALRVAGADPRAIVGWVASSAGLTHPTRLTASELANGFDITAARASGRKTVHFPPDLHDRWR